MPNDLLAPRPTLPSSRSPAPATHQSGAPFAQSGSQKTQGWLPLAGLSHGPSSEPIPVARGRGMLMRLWGPGSTQQGGRGPQGR